MLNVSNRIAYFIILTGCFVLAVFAIANYEAMTAQQLYFIFIPLIIFLFSFGIAVGQKVAFPIKDLVKQADYFSRQNVRRRFQVRSNDEMGQLSAIFNRIVEDFEHQKTKVDSLDANVKLRTKALEGIIAVLEDKIKNRTTDFMKIREDFEKTHALLRLREKELTELKTQMAQMTKKTKKAGVQKKKNARTS